MSSKIPRQQELDKVVVDQVVLEDVTPSGKAQLVLPRAPASYVVSEAVLMVLVLLLLQEVALLAVDQWLQ